MDQLLKNYSEYKKRLTEGNRIFDSRDYPFFCVILGYLLNKVQDFNLLYNTLSTALELVINDNFPQSEYFLWLMFINKNPHRVSDWVAFVDNLKNDDKIDILQQIQTLYNSEQYHKKPLQQSHRCLSIDTVVMQSQSPQRQKQQLIIYSHQQQQKPQYKDDFDIQLLKKMQQDQQMARRLQQEEQNIMREYKSNNMKEEQQTMCEICFVGLYDGMPAFLDLCGHGFHQDCMVESFKIQILDNNFPLKCPNASCKADCLQRDIKSILPSDLFQKYQQHTLKAYADMHGDSVSWCPTADCGYMFFYQKGDNVRFQCLECQKEYCLDCRCDWHKDMTCAEYKVTTTVTQDDKKFLDFVKGKKFKQCPKCKFWVEKNLGCDHMTCKCKFQFCYKCGGVYMKCQCAQKARQQHQRRMQARQEARRRKHENMEKKRKEKEEREERIARGQEPQRKTRSKRSKK